MKHWITRFVAIWLAGMLVLNQSVWAAHGASVALSQVMAQATSKSTISYQGYLVAADGSPVNAAALAMVFRLYNTAGGGAPLWQEAQNVAVSNGLFSVLLGEITPIPTTLLADNSDLWLGITVGSDTEMAPREKIASAPYALLSNIPDGSITEAKLGVSAVTTAKIQDGQVSSSDVGFNYAGSSSKGGAASDLACTNCVSSTEVQFNYAGSASEGGAASDLGCAGCVSSTDILDNTITETDIADTFIARNANLLDNRDSSYFAISTHTHDDRYYTESQSDSRFLNTDGDTMTGDLTLNTELYLKANVTSLANKDITLDPGEGTYNKVIVLDHMQVRGDLEMVSTWASRGNGGRALVHNDNDTLEINYNRDFSGGVLVNNFRTGAIIEENLMTPAQSQDFSLLPFEQGDVLCWNSNADRLAYCNGVASPMVVAVADDQGKPIVLGAEPMKVTGVVEPGDLLVSSDEPGYAAAWSQVGDNSAPIGLVIAKALESSDGGHNVIKAMILGR